MSEKNITKKPSTTSPLAAPSVEQALPADNSFSRNLLRAMKEQGVTRQQLADQANLGLSTINSYLAKENPPSPSLHNAVLIARTLGVSLDTLAGTTSIKKMLPKDTYNASVLLYNLAVCIKIAGLQISRSEKGTCRLTSKKPVVNGFLSSLNTLFGFALEEDVYNRIHTLASKYSDLVVFRGNLLTFEEYVKYLKEVSHAPEKDQHCDQDVILKELHDDIDKQWEKARGSGDYSFLRDIYELDESDYEPLLEYVKAKQ